MTLELLGYAGAILMGLSLGLIGGGGSILTVPILVYLFSVDAVLATAYSLFVVGLTSLIGSFSHMRLGNIHWRTAIVFGIPSIISVYLTRAYVVPAIPDPVFHLGNAAVSKAHAILLLFAVIMLLASYSMIRKRVVMENEEAEPRYNYPLILLEGIVVGAVTGLVGAGGGFLIIPALVLLTLCAVTYFAVFLGYGTQLIAMVGFYIVVSLWFHFWRYRFVYRGDQFTMPWPRPKGY